MDRPLGICIARTCELITDEHIEALRKYFESNASSVVNTIQR